MNGILAAGKRHRRIAHRVTGRTVSDHLRQVRFVASHRGGRRPSRTDIFAADERRSRPLFTGPTNADRIANGRCDPSHVVKMPFVRAHHDGAWHETLFHCHHIDVRAGWGTIAKAPAEATTVAKS